MEEKKSVTMFRQNKDIIAQSIIFSVLLYGYLWLFDKYGFERPVLSLMIFILITLRSIAKSVSKDGK